MGFPTLSGKSRCGPSAMVQGSRAQVGRMTVDETNVIAACLEVLYPKNLQAREQRHVNNQDGHYRQESGLQDSGHRRPEPTTPTNYSNQREIRNRSPTGEYRG